MKPVAPPDTCLNCGAETTDRYCASCGQDQTDPRQSVFVWLGRAFREELALDGRLPRTLVTLVLRPGELTADWMEGRRARHLPPLRLYLIVSVILFSITFFLGLPAGSLSLELPGAGLGRSLTEIMNNAFYDRFQTTLALTALGMVPVFALWMKLVQWRSDKLLVDHLVFSLHQHAALMLVLALTWPALFFVPPAWGWGTLVSLALLHAVLANARAYGREKWIRRMVLSAGGWGFILVGSFLGLAYYEIERSGTVDAPRLALARERANNLYVNVRTISPQPDSATEAAFELRALAQFGRVTDPEFLLSHDSVHMAELRVVHDSTEVARPLVERLVNDHPEDVTVRGLAMRWALRSGDTALAREHADAFLALPPPDSASLHAARGRIYRTEAEALLERGGT